MPLLTETQKKYLIQHYGKIPIRIIADVLELNRSEVHRIAQYYRGCGLMPAGKKPRECKSQTQVNPNPVTQITEMLICRYTYEGMGYDRIYDLLGRPPEVVDDVLERCRADGTYDCYNAYGREKRKKA